MVKATQGAIRSMTGFATARGPDTGKTGADARDADPALRGLSWGWELRSVNGRGFDLRLRLPDGIDALEQGVRAQIGAVVSRGSVSLSLRLDRAQGAAAARVDAGALAAMLDAAAQVQAAAMARGLTLAPTSAAEILSLRGVLDPSAGAGETADPASLCAALLAELPALIADFDAMRLQEGAALGQVIAAQLTRIAALVDAAEATLAPRQERQRAALSEAMARISDIATNADPARLEQELALLATKSDVAEELDRLRAHVDAARALLGQGGQVGRKLDFLTQEFNREANTLCAKSQSAALTRIGLDLKAVIDQMREQVQNVE